MLSLVSPVSTELFQVRRYFNIFYNCIVADSNGNQPKPPKYPPHPNNMTGSRLHNLSSSGGPKKHSGIRSLLGADNSSNDSSNSNTKPHGVSSSDMFQAGGSGLTLMDVVKNNIEEAIRHDADFAANAEANRAAAAQSKLPISSIYSSLHQLPHLTTTAGGMFHHKPGKGYAMCD